MNKIYYFAICVMACLVSCNPNGGVLPEPDNGDVVPGTEDATLRKVATGDVFNITSRTAVITGSTKIDLSDYQDVAFGVMYSDNKDELSARRGNRNEAPYLNGQEFEVEIKGLKPQTVYYYCAWLFLNGKQYEYGDIKQFETLEDAIGKFSVSNTKKVAFSSGNLQYTQSTNTWSFAENQWDMIGTDNVKGGSVYSDDEFGDEKHGTALADKVDLFGWSTSATNYGVSTSTSISDYSGSFVDWGTNKIGSDAPNTWRTLTYDEWKYLLNTRPNASSLKGVAQVNGVNGLILLPDNWTCPSGVTFKSGFHNNYGVDYYAAYQTFTAAEWSKLESAGAVFLPVAGYRNGSDVDNVQYVGFYWSATEHDSNSAGCLYFDSDEAFMRNFTRYYGHSVRLVKDL